MESLHIVIWSEMCQNTEYSKASFGDTLDSVRSGRHRRRRDFLLDEIT